MNTDIILKNFHEVANAPEGVSRIRALILQLAATGNLISGKPNDGNSQELLDEIAQKRNRLISTGEIKGSSHFQEVDSSPQLPIIPNNWNWIRLGNLASKIGSGSTPSGGSKVYTTSGVIFLRSQNIWNDGIRLDEAVYISAATHEEMRNTHVHPNDILLNITGASLGRCACVPSNFPPANVSQHVTIIRPIQPETRHFVRICLLSPFGQEMIWGRQVGMAREGLSKKVLEQFEIPLPPLQEQKRIVAKVDELMALCDRLEAQQQERQTLLPILSQASHTRFLSSPSPEGLNRIFDKIGNVSSKHLRRTIVDLAVRGKLIEHRSHSANVEQLIQSIQKERNKSDAKQFRTIEESEAPHQIPISWKWVRLGNLALSSDSGWSPQCESFPRAGNAWGVLKVSAVSWGEFLPDENKALPVSMEGSSEYEVRDGDFLLSRANTDELVARSVVVKDPPPHLMLSDKIIRFNFPRLINKEYVNLANTCAFARGYYAQNATGTSSSMKNVGRDVMNNLPIALPPLREQHEIVSKVNQLFALIDTLDEQQQERDHLAQLFAKAVVAELAGTQIAENNEQMKAPKAQLISNLKPGKCKPKAKEDAPLATLLNKAKGELSAKSLWQQSGLTIDAFYQQLKAELVNGWIAPPKEAIVQEAEQISEGGTTAHRLLSE